MVDQWDKEPCLAENIKINNGNVKCGNIQYCFLVFVTVTCTRYRCDQRLY